MVDESIFVLVCAGIMGFWLKRYADSKEHVDQLTDLREIDGDSIIPKETTIGLVERYEKIVISPNPQYMGVIQRCPMCDRKMTPVKWRNKVPGWYCYDCPNRIRYP